MSKLDPAELIAAQLCLDFANTLSPRHSSQALEQLVDYGSLLDWALRSGSLMDQAAARLRTLAAARPEKGGQALEQARELRETIFRLLDAAARSQPARADDLQDFNHLLGQALAYARLSAGVHAYAWSWEERQDPPLLRPCWPVVRSAAGLLTSAQLLDRLGVCADPQCGWLFLDSSKSRTRKWCDIRDCGNREKQRRYSKKRSAALSRPTQSD